MATLFFKRGLTLFITIFILASCSQRSDRVVAVEVHPTKPNIIYVATEEGVYTVSYTHLTLPTKA